LAAPRPAGLTEFQRTSAPGHARHNQLIFDALYAAALVYALARWANDRA
jgi:hypothetical protein